MEVGWDNVLGFIHIFTNVTQWKGSEFQTFSNGNHFGS